MKIEIVVAIVWCFYKGLLPFPVPSMPLVNCLAIVLDFIENKMVNIGDCLKQKIFIMRTFILSLFMLLLFANMAYTQGENNIWTFGYHNGLNFNTNPPSFFSSNIISWEGCAALSDANGNLMFYSNGNNVWDANGSIMPNGSGLEGNGIFDVFPGSSSQGVIIAQTLINSNQYYIFTLDEGEYFTQNTTGYLRYSIVDMSLNNGLGDVLSTQKNVIVDSNMSECMTVVKGDGCYYWLITRRYPDAVFSVFKIDASGIHPAANYPALVAHVIGGQIKVSPDKSRIALAGAGIYNRPVELGMFNSATGAINNIIALDSGGVMRYGACFSPDNSKLYINNTGRLEQYDIATYPNAASIISSRVTLDSFKNLGALRNGPDGKIYAACLASSPYIRVVNAPNNAGIACNFDPQGIQQAPGTVFPTQLAAIYYGSGLGDDVMVLSGGQGAVVSDTTICAKEGPITLTAAQSFNHYIWSNGATTNQITINSEGTYWVKSSNDCSSRIDTFRVTFIDFELNLGNDTTICSGSILELDATVDGAQYLWQNGSTAARITVLTTGIYTVKVTKNGCSVYDTIDVKVVAPFAKIIERDTIVCDAESIELHVSTNLVQDCVWQDGNAGTTYMANRSGYYSIMANSICGKIFDSVFIRFEKCDCIPFIPNAFSPNADGLNDYFEVKLMCSFSEYRMQIYNRYGECVFESFSPDKRWNGRQFDKNAELGIYYYYLKFKNLFGKQIVFKGDIHLLR